MNQTGKSSLFAETFIRIWKNEDSRVEVVLPAFIVLSCVAASTIIPYGANEMDLTGMFGTLSLKHIFGTDAMGRDLFSRLLYGGRYSLVLGICTTVFSAVLGCLIDCIAGYFGDKTGTLIMRFLDIWSSFPSILLCILVSAVLGAGFFRTVLALAIGNVPTDVRLIQGQILLECSKDHLEAAQSINCSRLNIMFHHILPNVVSSVTVNAIMNIGMNITMVAALPYIGLGVQSPTPEWGAMLADTRAHILNYLHLIMFPGIVIALTVPAINLIDDGLCDAIDPRFRS